ncbi:hypothetical protein SLA2020_438250 [Shorea laevis]
MDEELQKRTHRLRVFSSLTPHLGLNVSIGTARLRGSIPQIAALGWHAGAAPESANCSTPVNKTNAPCYFYFNGFCNKGDRCSFMHGPDGSAPAETHLNPSESASKLPINLNFLPKEELQQAVPKILFLQSASPQIAVCEYDDAVIRSESLIPAEGFIQGRSHICTDQSSEEQVEDDIEPEERWESSPGFDVLVDDKSENLGYEDDPEYLLDLDREHRELNSHFLVYDFEDSVEYNPMYPDAELLCERDICDGKRKLVPMELAVGDCNDMDLRNHLRRRRVIDDCRIPGSSRRHGSSHLIDRSQKRPQRHGMGPWLHRRLASEVGKYTIESLGENGTFLNGANQHGLLRRSQQDRSKKHFRKRRLPKRHFSSEVSRKPIERERRSTHESNTFTGPKTLDQIKEEKKKAEDNGDYIWKFGNSSRTTLANFQGPKPLSEILKGKRRLDSVRDSDTSGR